MDIYSIVGIILIVNSAVGQRQSLKSVDKLANHTTKYKDCNSLKSSFGEQVTDEGTEDLCRDKVRVEDVRYVCRHTDYVVIKWTSIFGFGLSEGNVTYLIEKWSTNDSEAENNGRWIKQGWTSLRNHTVDGLKKKTEYKFRVTPFYYGKFPLGWSSATDLITTFKGNEVPRPPTNFNVTYSVEDESGKVKGLVFWDPPEDLTCTIVLYPFIDGFRGTIDDYQETVHAGNSLEVNNLKYEVGWHVYVYSTINRKESDRRTYDFETPSCSKLNPTICASDAPVIADVEDNCTYVNISWQKPLTNPYFYNIIYINENKTENFTVEGSKTNYGFEIDNSLKEGLYIIYLIAVGSAGQSETNYKSSHPVCSIERKIEKVIVPMTGKIILLVVTALAVPTIIIFVTVWRLYFYGKMLQKDVDMMRPDDSFRKDVGSKNMDSQQTDSVDVEQENSSKVKIYDEYEVHRDQVRLCQVLGEGEFGVVHKAVLVENNCYLRYVAVKTLRNKESVEEKRQLEKEIEVMKSVGKHRNIVSLLGCCTEDMMLIVEYCSLGDLRRFLRKTWQIKTCAEEAISEESNRDLLERRAFSNILYDQSGPEKRYLSLSMMDLLSIARQIALGMAYLADNRVVHRDVAARNVLLTQDMTAKIADFGLSRDVYERNIYMKRSTDKLPLRWMALESLQYQVFSTKSDVWSYGILLWEIMTLGGCPYPSLQTSEMYKLLQEGYRMERPKPCTPQLYEIMLNCWDAKAQNRPSFAQLVVKVEEIMKNESNRSYLDLSTCDYKNHLDEGLG